MINHNISEFCSVYFNPVCCSPTSGNRNTYLKSPFATLRDFVYIFIFFQSGRMEIKMQIEKINGFVLLSVPVDVLIESGVSLNGVIRISAGEGKIVIHSENFDEEYVCDHDCENCPFCEVGDECE